jgi:hypothetical protein
LLETLVPRVGLEFGIALGSLPYLLPVFLASQTIPLVTQLNTTDGTRAGLGAGKMLFFSTLGSVAGGALTPIILFQQIGVGASAVLVVGILLLCAFICAVNAFTFQAAVVLALVCTLLLPVTEGMATIDTAYQTIQIYRGDQLRGEGFDRSVNARYFVANGAAQSGVNSDGESAYEYAQQLVRIILEQKPRGDVLIVGAAGFTIPMDLAAHGVRSTAVDIDPQVRAVAERWLWSRSLSPLIRFQAQSARLALRNATPHEIVVLDAFSGRTMPAELLTFEALRDARGAATTVIANMVLDRALTSRLARNALTTFRAATGALYVHVGRTGGQKANVLVSNTPLPGFASRAVQGSVYRDDRHTIESDKIALL